MTPGKKKEYTSKFYEKISPRKRLTSVISLRAVSQPSENSVPGTLLLIVEGIIAIGKQNSLNDFLLSYNCNPAWYAYSTK